MAGLQVFCGVGEGGAAATIGGNAKDCLLYTSDAADDPRTV